MATAKPTAIGRQLVSRSSPTWIDIPTAASATRIRLRATMSSVVGLLRVDQADGPQRREREETEDEQRHGPADATPRQRSRPVRLLSARRPARRR